MTEHVDVATRLRTLADAPWVARGDAATQAALREGADEVERLRLLCDTQAALIAAQAAHIAIDDREEALTDAMIARHEAAARGMAWELAEARNEVAVLRARLDALGRREMSAVAQRDALARMYGAVGQALGVDHAGDIPEALHRALADRDEAEGAVEKLTLALADADEDDARSREGFDAFRAQALRERAQGAAGDLAGLGARAAGGVTVGEGEGR